MMTRNERFPWIMAMLLALAGCAAAPSSGERATTPLAREESSAGQEIPAPRENPAVVALLGNADAKEQAGQYEQAAATLERALRLEPRNAMLWHRLAQARLSQSQWRVAADLAAKSNSLAAGNADLQARNWAVIAEARERMGDSQGAEAARARMKADGAAR